MKRNILIIIRQLTGGGAERVASNLSIHLPEDKYTKYILVNDSKVLSYPYGGRLLDLNSRICKSLLGKILINIFRIIKISRYKRDLNIDTSISLLSGANIMNILSYSKAKTVVSVRNNLTKSSASFYGRIDKYLTKILYNRADYTVALSEGVKEDLIYNFKLDKNKIRVIYNPFNIEYIKKMSKQIIEPEHMQLFTGNVIISTGRLSHQKGHWHLIRAFKLVKRKIPDSKLIILGEGELRGYLEQLVRDLNLENDVHFLGFCNNPFKYISRADVAVFPSLFEGFGNVIVESMICECPVIVSDCESGPREIMTKTNICIHKSNSVDYAEFGVLIPVPDGKHYFASDDITNEEKNISESIIRLLKDKSLKENYKRKGLERANHFCIDEIIQQWVTLIEN